MPSVPTRAEVEAARQINAQITGTEPAPTAVDTAGVFAFRVDDEVFVFRVDEMASAHDRELWQQSGMTGQQIGEMMDAGTITPWMIAGLAFLARRQSGDARVKYATLEQLIDDADVVEPLSDDEVADALRVSRLVPPHAGR